MELGVFIPIGNNGWLISTTSPQYKPSFDLNREVVQKAERFIADETDAAAIAKWEHHKAGTDMEALAWRDAQAETIPARIPTRSGTGAGPLGIEDLPTNQGGLCRLLRL